MSDISRVPLESLLAHRNWVHALALRISRDAWDADDLEQATWAAVVARPPRDAGSPRGWLATVMRGLAHNLRRDAARRSARERAAAPREAVISTDELAARADAEQIVIRAVLALDEPYRSVVLLRFFEDLPPRRIAARLQVPVETVRTRLRRALAKLREDLDGRAGGTEAWCAAFFGGPASMLAAGSGVPRSATRPYVLRRVAVIAAAFAVGGGLGVLVAAAPRGPSPDETAAATEHATRVASRANGASRGEPPVASGLELDKGSASSPNAARIGRDESSAAAAAASGAMVPAIADAATNPAAGAAGASRTWRLRIERPGWHPEVVTGTLVVGGGRERAFGNLFFNEIGRRSAVPLVIAESGADRLDATFDLSGEAARLTGRIDAKSGTLCGEIAVDRPGRPEHQPATGSLVSPERFDSGAAPESWPLQRDPAAAGLDPGALDRILAEAEASDTEALYVVKDGSLVCRRTFGRPAGPLALHSITRSVASLAIPLLIDEGKIPGLDTPLSRWFPGLDVANGSLTLRDVLTETQSAEARSAKADLLAEIVRIAAGEPVDRYVGRKILDPLGARCWTWGRDAAGNASARSGLAMEPADLARLGEMLANGGTWHGDQIVPQWWIGAVQTAGAPPLGIVGPGWNLRRDADHEEVVQTAERVAALEAAGFTGAAKLEPLNGRRFASAWDYNVALHALRSLTNDEYEALHNYMLRGVTPLDARPEVIGFFMDGSHGQFLLVYPRWRLVAVRMRRGLGDLDSTAGFDREGYQRALPFFPGLVESAVIR